MKKPNCELHNPTARKTVGAVWRHLRANFLGDADFLAGIVKRIIPLSAVEAAAGTQGQWNPADFKSLDETVAFYRRFGDDHGQYFGVLELLDTAQLSTQVVAHELGHAFASLEDLMGRDAPTDEWASEAVADMHAVRWGLLTLDDIRQRHADNIAGPVAVELTTVTAWVHHGPVPGGGWIEIYGDRWRLSERFVFERA
jgi:hypothetical protein